MKYLSKFAVISTMALSLALIFAGPARAADEDWLTNFEKAKAKAAAEGKDLLIDFSGSDWCGWCIKLDNEVFSKKAFKDYAEHHFVLTLIDFPRDKSHQSEAIIEQNKKLQEKYGIRGFPTIILAEPSGEPYARTGYKDGGPENYVKHLKELRKKSELDWATNFEAAKQKAAALNKDLLIDFSGSDWCGWCIRLDKEVFSKDKFQEYAREHFVPVLIDFPRDKSKQSKQTIRQNSKLQEKYGIRGFPTIILAGPSGEPYARTGYKSGGPEAYVSHLTDLKKKSPNDKKQTAQAGSGATEKEDSTQ